MKLISVSAHIAEFILYRFMVKSMSVRIREFTFFFSSAIMIIFFARFREFVLLAKFAKIKTLEILPDLQYEGFKQYFFYSHFSFTSSIRNFVYSQYDLWRENAASQCYVLKQMLFYNFRESDKFDDTCTEKKVDHVSDTLPVNLMNKCGNY